MLSRAFQIRSRVELPFYCHPAKLFVSVWLLMLVSLQLHISYTTYPGVWTPIGLFIFSISSFVMGYLTLYFADRSVRRPSTASPATYRIDVVRLRRLHFLAFAVMISIVILNLKVYGLPPIFGFVGSDTLDYTEYGSLRQVLFAAIMFLFVSAPLEPLRLRRWLFYWLSCATMLAYVSRGYLLIMLLQALMVFSLRSALSKKQLYVVAGVTLGVGVLLANFIGNGRNSIGADALLGYMQIKRNYYDWPSSYLWMISYISTPISNMCWILQSYHYDHPSGTSLYSLLPAFWAPKSLELADLGNDNIVDGVHTYLAKYYLDLSYLGIFIINYLWGSISGFISVRNRLVRNYLTSAVLLGCIGFIFFADFLTILIIILELLALGLAQTYFTVEAL